MKWSRISAVQRRRVLRFLRRNANPHVVKLYCKFMEQQRE